MSAHQEKNQKKDNRLWDLGGDKKEQKKMKIQNFGKPLSRLIIMVAICMLSLHSMAYDFSYTYQGKTLYYTITSSNTVQVANNYGSVSGDVVIPSSVTNNGTTYSVTSIGERAFSYCSSLTSVTIPNSVTSIGNSAFRNCSGLTSVTIGNSVTSIGNYAFCYCSSLTSVTIPNSVTSIGNYAFSWCSGLTSVTIPNIVTSIGDAAFSDCSSLTSVTIPNSVTSIGADAFYECSGLNSVTIGNSVTSIGNYAFAWCSSLTSVTIPNSVTSIGEWAFTDCSSLTSVTLPNNATIHSGAFIGAGEKPTIDSVIYCNDTLIVGNYTFICTGFLTFYLNGNSYFPNNNAVVFDCDKSKSGNLIIPSAISYNGTTYSVTSIGKRAFYYCIGLTSVTIPYSVTSIADYAFEGCISLTSIVSNAVVPPALGSEFFPYPNSCNVIVPCGSLETYTSSQWNDYFPSRIEQDCSVSLQEVESTREFVVYPNPIRGFATVEFEALQERSLLIIADLGGRIVKTFDLSAGMESVRLDLRDLPSGVYTLMIGNTTKKLIVE